MAVHQARAWFLLLLLGASCKPAQTSAREFAVERERMVKEQIAMRGVTDERVLRAMRKVAREQFVPEQIRGQSYSDGPLPIGFDQTISQPFVVAFMTEKLGLRPTDRVLEIGTGSGYQAAILAELAGKVYTIEIVEPWPASKENPRFDGRRPPLQTRNFRQTNQVPEGALVSRAC